MIDQTIKIGNKSVRGPFVIPSGIRCTRASTIEWCFKNVPSVGVVTTKSISFAPRAGYREPIYARYARDSFINAVGLSNPGAELFLKELQQIEVPDDKFLLVSIFGGNVSQFVRTATALLPAADGFELNMSCPHAEGYGVEIGQKKELVSEITAAVVAATGLPVVVKLSAIVGDVGLTAKAALDAGAAGITVSNTIGPASVLLGDVPILTNRVGGLSGAAIRPLALRAVKRVREVVGEGPLIIGMGGVSSGEDVLQFKSAGADLFGIGSALTGMDSRQMQSYFQGLSKDLLRGERPLPALELPQMDMSYHKVKVVSRHDYHGNLFKLVVDHLPIEGIRGELAGKYFFVLSQGVGEKPFAIFCADEKSIVVRVAGAMTAQLATLGPGAELFLRGPYGRALPEFEGRTVVLIGGGTGIASLLEPAKKLHGKNELRFMVGGRSRQDLFDLEKFEALGTVEISTNDGSAGTKGLVSDLLANRLINNGPEQGRKPLYIVCGPEPMVEACFKLLETAAADEDVWGAIEYTTSCGVGICGKCASPSGSLTCIDGPFMQRSLFKPSSSLLTCP